MTWWSGAGSSAWPCGVTCGMLRSAGCVPKMCCRGPGVGLAAFTSCEGERGDLREMDIPRHVRGQQLQGKRVGIYGIYVIAWGLFGSFGAAWALRSISEVLGPVATPVPFVTGSVPACRCAACSGSFLASLPSLIKWYLYRRGLGKHTKGLFSHLRHSDTAETDAGGIEGDGV